MDKGNKTKGTPPDSPISNISDLSDYDLQLPAWSLNGLQNAAIQLQLARPRSLAWAILLHAVPPFGEDIVSSLNTHRNFYNDLRKKLSMDPRAVIDDDPLSQNDESAWKRHFCDNELRALILQDVVRTFPDDPYYRASSVQDLMVRILFFWARSHPLGYRQGMHEVLAPLLRERHVDAEQAPVNMSETLKHYLDEEYLEHDSFMLLNAVMKGLERFYSTGDALPGPGGRLPVSRMRHAPTEVVRYLEQARAELLVPRDPELAARLDHCNITMELFGIRWLRLLFGREFPSGAAARLWGFAFAPGPALAHLRYLVVAILIANRDTLLDPEPGVALSALMRPMAAPAGHVCALALHLLKPDEYPKPAPYKRPTPVISDSDPPLLEQTGAPFSPDLPSDGSEGVPEGSDVARELAALALLRARLPPAAAALARALPAPPPSARGPLQQILQLSALLQCRNHALVDVETALEAAEGQTSRKSGRKSLVPVSMIGGKRASPKQTKPVNKVKEVPLKVFHQADCVSASDLPCLDPLRLRTE